VPPLRVDAQSVLDAWDVLAVELVTESGLSGWGYQCGFGPAMAALKHFVDGAILPDLIGCDARRHSEWWPELYLLRHHTGLNGPAVQGLSAPEVAAWDLQTALRCAPALADFDVAWLEEPLYPFDVRGHAELAAAITTPLLHGENLYEPLMIRDMLGAGALDIVQPSDMKLGGITRWMDVAEMARAAGRKVVPAGWTMLQIDQHLAAASPHCWMVESIPWIRDIFQEPARLEDGHVVVSDAPGAGTAIKPEFIDRYAI
jgi:L-alanine-DL-glutamate epimerase-like enolase superfamily enzyme